MAKFNTGTTRAAVSSPVRTEPTPSGLTHEGAPGYARDVKSELFLLAVSNMVGERVFYEDARSRDDRYERLVRQATGADPEWTAAFLGWLRSEANMRSASLVGAAQFTAERLLQDKPGMSRQVVASVLQRADEPGEMLAYWTSTFGRNVPKPVKRGVADAVRRLYSERSLLKYDGASKGYRFGDVLDLTHPTPVADWQGALFQHALDRRHGRDDASLDGLGVLTANADLRTDPDPAAWLDPERLYAAGMTWEDALSAVGSKVDKARLWSALAPGMGYMALLRNLRNFDEAGMSDEDAAMVAVRLADPAQVAKSRQLPFRFLSAHLAAPSQRWGHALDRALTASTRNVPTFGGRTLVLVDTSASMTSGAISARSQVTPAWAAALFGVALAVRGENVDLCGFADGVFVHKVGAGASVLKEVERFIGRTGEVGHGTAIARSVRTAYRGHDRVVILSDMQTMSGYYGAGVSEQVPAHIPTYGWNLGGYEHAAMETGARNRHEFGGFSDAAFRLIPLLEAGRNADWPWMTASPR